MSGDLQKMIEKLKAGISIEGDCWQWTKSKTAAGYGQICFSGKVYYVHRLSYELFKGPLNGRFVLHSCDNPACCNPAHLSAGSQAENLADMRGKKRHAHGVTVPNHKLLPEKIEKIRADSRSQYQIARDFGVNQSQVSRIKSNKRWRHV